MSTPSPVPVPRGDYRPAARHGAVIYTAGMTPREDGELIAVGTVGADLDVDRARAAARRAITNALAAVESCIAPGEVITRFLRMTVFVRVHLPSPSTRRWPTRPRNISGNATVRQRWEPAQRSAWQASLAGPRWKSS